MTVITGTLGRLPAEGGFCSGLAVGKGSHSKVEGTGSSHPVQLSQMSEGSQPHSLALIPGSVASSLQFIERQGRQQPLWAFGRW